jgi:hypothetical protein
VTAGWLLQRLGPFNPRLEPRVFGGILGVMLLFFALGTMHSLGVPLFAPLDEPRHIAYAIEVAEGKLPDVRDKVQPKKMHVRRIKGTKMMAAAAHPPLYYVLVGFPLKWASASGDLTWGVWVARILTLALGAVGLVYAYLAALLLAPRARSLALLGTAFCAVIPAFDNVCALVHNDSLAFLATTALLHAVLLVLLRGPSRKALLLVAVWAALAAATRFASLVAVAPALTAVALKLLFGQNKPWSARLRDVLLFGVGSLALVGVTSGWFYLRNYRLYGDVTAGKALFEGLRRPNKLPFIEGVFTPRLWGKLISHLWGRLAGGATIGRDVSLWGTWFVLGGVGLSLVRWLVTLLRRGRALFNGPRVAALLFVIVTSLCVVLPIFEFYSRGGNLTARYYFPVLWVPLLAVAAGYQGVPGRFAAPAALLFVAGLGLWCTELYMGVLMRQRQTGFAVVRAFDVAQLPASSALAGLLVTVWLLGLGLVIWAWFGLQGAERRERLSSAVQPLSDGGTA